MTPLRSGLDLRPTLLEVCTTGTGFIDQALDEDFIQQLTAEAQALDLQPMPSQEGRPHQEGEVCALQAPFAHQPAIRRLCNDLTHVIHTHGLPISGYTAWKPNEVHIQRYQAGMLGITPHLDLKRYHYLVAVFTIEGVATFTICKDRTGEALLTWQAGPGSLVLLRAPGLADIENGRPLHAVAGPSTGQRTSISYRMNTQLVVLAD